MARRIPEETKRSIIEAARIDEVVGEFVVLKKRGANYWGNCPFHNEKTASFSVSPSKNIFKCFGCGKAGDSVTFLMEHEHYTYVEALKYLAAKYNIEIEEEEPTPEQIQKESDRESLYHVTQFAAEYFSRNLWESEEGRSVGLSYFRERRFTDEMIKHFQLGYCPEAWDGFTQTALKQGYDKKYLIQSGLTIEKEDSGKLFDRFRGRVIFPIHSPSGRVLGFGGRILINDKTKAKYVNSPESDIYHKSMVLYALPFAKKEIIARDVCYMVEGYADVVSMHQAGITNVVASSGTSLTEDQIKLISRFTRNLTLLYDGDPAGIKASLRGIDMVLAKDMNVRVVLLPDGQDPDDYAKQHSTDQILDYLKSNAVDFITFKTRLLMQDAGTDPIKKAELVENILTSISVIPDEIKRALYVQECSRQTGVSENDLMQKLNRIFRNKFKNTLRQEGNETAVPDKNLNPVEPAGARPEDREADSRQHEIILERELLRLLVCYGQAETTQVYIDAENNKIPQISGVCGYIVPELQVDNMVFSQPLHRQLFDIFAAQLAEGRVPSLNELMLSDNVEIRNLVADLAATPFEISKNWETKGLAPRTEADQSKLNEVVFHAVLNFKLKRVGYMLEETDGKIKRAQEENDELGLMAGIEEKRRIELVKKKISDMIRRVVL